MAGAKIREVGGRKGVGHKKLKPRSKPNLTQ